MVFLLPVKRLPSPLRAPIVPVFTGMTGGVDSQAKVVVNYGVGVATSLRTVEPCILY